MYPAIKKTVESFHLLKINEDRKILLEPLIDFIQNKINEKQQINLNFICTHNSRRSHFAQIWAQVSAAHFNIYNVNCYSGGTEETALFPKIVETLSQQGFQILKIAESNNPIYAIKFDENARPIIGFSKKYDSLYNPVSKFAAILTCSHADKECPFVAGAEKRIPITFEDPKIADNTPEQDKVYTERSWQIATEMFYVFSKINK
ncbi:protein-tyrosine-phosphatase [Chryseobacterium sp. POL2]|uniref:protein-tyrosine-phosphatase n=1 Tax=Chryseobacterium sp. POL2 TaxID=2713414 RepID=UPI0013E0FB6B|nr:protein-tyrosine-phosphatase [Chryseobacterium sp. POL2]QIG88476.1 protein-tyrosine-phosphatase [Chryseobacterium sp. POL2]